MHSMKFNDSELRKLEEELDLIEVKQPAAAASETKAIGVQQKSTAASLTARPFLTGSLSSYFSGLRRAKPQTQANQPIDQSVNGVTATTAINNTPGSMPIAISPAIAAPASTSRSHGSIGSTHTVRSNHLELNIIAIKRILAQLSNLLIHIAEFTKSSFDDQELNDYKLRFTKILSALKTQQSLNPIIDVLTNFLNALSSKEKFLWNNRFLTLPSDLAENNAFFLRINSFMKELSQEIQNKLSSTAIVQADSEEDISGKDDFTNDRTDSEDEDSFHNIPSSYSAKPSILTKPEKSITLNNFTVNEPNKALDEMYKNIKKTLSSILLKLDLIDDDEESFQMQSENLKCSPPDRIRVSTQAFLSAATSSNTPLNHIPQGPASPPKIIGVSKHTLTRSIGTNSSGSLSSTSNNAAVAKSAPSSNLASSIQNTTVGSEVEEVEAVEDVFNFGCG